MVIYKKEKLLSFSTVMLKQAESLCPPPAASTSDGFRSNLISLFSNKHDSNNKNKVPLTYLSGARNIPFRRLVH